MSGFITRLTGITKDDVRNAPTSDEVFRNFYNWVKADRAAVFYCYGDSDITFIQSNLKRTTNIEAIVALKYILGNLVDFSVEVRQYFGLYKQISLKKLVAYYRGVETIEQAHDALEDSMFLKEVYEHITSEEADTDAFPEYKVNAMAPKVQVQESKKKKKARSLAAQMEIDKVDIGLVRYSKTHSDEWACGNLYTAIMHCIKKMRRKHPEIKQDITILYPALRKEILAAMKNNTKYCKYFWKKKD